MLIDFYEPIEFKRRQPLNLSLSLEQGSLHALFDWESQKVFRLLSHPVHHPFIYMHHIWRVAIFFYMVDCKSYVFSSDGFTRGMVVH